MDWRTLLARQVDALGPMPRGRFLTTVAGEDWVAGERMLDPGFLRAAIARARPAAIRTARDGDPRIGVSRMSRQYCAALTCAAITGLANGIGLDLSPPRCSVVFRDELPARIALPRPATVSRCAERPTGWPVTGPVAATLDELRRQVWRTLYAENLRPMFAAAVGLANVPDRLLWTNAAEWVAIVMDSARAHLEPEAAGRVVAEGRAVLAAEFLPGFGGEPNPLRGRLDWVPFDDAEIPTRHLCCLVYLHDDRHGRLCHNCPLLPLSDRAALLRERLSAPASPGPAERRSIEIGLGRRRF